MDTGLLLTSLIAIAFEILFPLFVGLWLHRRWRVSWNFFAYGALVFFIFQIATRIPAILYLQSLPQYGLQSAIGQAATSLPDPIASFVRDHGFFLFWAFATAFTAGLFEEGGRYFGYRFLWKKEEKNWPRALMYGAGHGGLESMLLVGGLALWQLLQMVWVSQVDLATVPSEQFVAVYEAQMAIATVPWWSPLLGALERLLAMVVHISLSVLVLQVFRRGRFVWWWAALGYHTLVNLATVVVSYFVSPYLPLWANLLLPEGVMFLLALSSVGIILSLREGPAAPGAGPVPEDSSADKRASPPEGELLRRCQPRRG